MDYKEKLVWLDQEATTACREKKVIFDFNSLNFSKLFIVKLFVFLGDRGLPGFDGPQGEKGDLGRPGLRGELKIATDIMCI